MWTDGDPIREMRARLRALLPPRAFLKRDRGDALFISNAPAVDPSFSGAPGFCCARRGALMTFLPDASWLVRLEARRRCPPDDLCAGLVRFRGAPVSHETILLFTRGTKLMELTDAPEAELAAYDRAVRQAAAAALRGGMDGGGLYALALIDYKLRQKSKGGNIR